MQEQSQPRVLVVDNDEHASALIQNLLGHAGFNVTSTTECATAMILLQSSDFASVFVDEALVGQLWPSILGCRKATGKPFVIVLQSGIPNPRGTTSYNSFPADGFVNKRRACDILDAAGEAVSAAVAR